MNVTKDWLERLHGRSPGHFSLTVFVNGKIAAVKGFTADEIETAAQQIDNTQTGDIYVSCATYSVEPTRNHRGAAKQTTAIPGFWIEIDIDGPGHKPDVNKLPLPKTLDQALSILDGGPEPTAIVHSGGGLHVWWLFDQPWSFSDYAEAQAAEDDWLRLYQKKAADKGYSIDNVSNLDRILRPPGTFNRKLKENEREVTLFRDTKKKYQSVELAQMGLAPPPRSHAEVVDESGLGSWAEILEPHGWQQIRERDDGAIEWRRPGKTEGSISAVSDPFGVPVLVNFSSDAGLPAGPGQRLTKFKVWAHLNYGGDLVAAKAALDARKVNDDSALIQRAEKYLTSLINGPEFWKEKDPEVEWLAEPIIEQGRQIAIYSEAKQGKSLVLLEICAALATGSVPFTDKKRDPIDILYLDKENMRVDIRERLQDMGYGPENDPFNRLHYSWFPDMPWFDKPEGGLDLLAMAIATNAKLVVIDTLSRVVEGEENKPDTYHNFYKHTGVWLKQRGITLVRLDHSGKDFTKGMRGASSKTTDVDDVWSLSADDPDEGPIRMNRTHSRANHGTGSIVLERFKEPLRHMPSAMQYHIGENREDSIEACMTAMDLADIPADMGLLNAYEKFKDSVNNKTGKNTRKWTKDQIQEAQCRKQGGRWGLKEGNKTKGCIK